MVDYSFLIVKELVTGALNIDEIYTFVIGLVPEGRYALGFAQATMLY